MKFGSKSRKFGLLFSFLSLLTWCTCVNASPNLQSDNDENGWHLSFAPYGWFSGVDGDVTMKGDTTHIHIPFKDILKDLDFAAEAHLEANKGRWTFMIDPTYLKLSQDVEKVVMPTITLPDSRILYLMINANAEITSATTLVDSGIFYRVLQTAPGADQYASFELLGGARYLGLNNSLDFTRSLNAHLDDFTFNQVRSGNVSANSQMIAPIIGARIKFDPTSRTHLWLRGDGGGFGVDNVRRTLSATTGIAYTLCHHVDVGIAYRALDISFTRPKSSMNIVMYGPMAGVAFYS